MPSELEAISCPTNIITLIIFAANISSYSHYVFSTLDHEDSGIITFEVCCLLSIFPILLLYLYFDRILWLASPFW